MNYDIVIIGGGLAGLTAALHLSREQYSILVIEKQPYPNHKVCGEYLSNEIKPYLQSLGITLPAPVNITTLQLSTQNGVSLTAELPLGGMGISRYALDNALYKQALEKEVAFVFEKVTRVVFNKNRFNATTAAGVTYKAGIVIGAYGKRSGIDKFLDREFIHRRSPWLGVKAHYNLSDFPDEIVALHNFEGGYAGLSKTEKGNINFCYLVNYKSFNRYNEIKHFNNKVLCKNPFLKTFLETATPVFEAPITIAQISFEPKSAVENHMLMCGDTAGLIHPLCGNGMAMAIHSAKIAAEHIIEYFNSADRSRQVLESNYAKRWEGTFNKRLANGRRLQRLLMQPLLANSLVRLAVNSPFVLRKVIESTHGKPVVP